MQHSSGDALVTSPDESAAWTFCELKFLAVIAASASDRAAPWRLQSVFQLRHARPCL